VRSSGANGRYSTALPADVAAAASWDIDAAYDYGKLIGTELRAQGFNMTSRRRGHTREPRNGAPSSTWRRPDPGRNVGGAPDEGTQSEHVIGDIKHYAFNDQESGRNAVNITLSKRAARESDLLAFEIGVEQGHPDAVMCSYNAYSATLPAKTSGCSPMCSRKDWHFPGFVLSDWGGTHSTEKASAAGLDHEEPGAIL